MGQASTHITCFPFSNLSKQRLHLSILASSWFENCRFAPAFQIKFHQIFAVESMKNVSFAKFPLMPPNGASSMNLLIITCQVPQFLKATTVRRRPIEAAERKRMRCHRVNLVLSALMLLVGVVMFAGYLLWAGAHQPGGAFQAGALLAGASVLMFQTGVYRINYTSIVSR